MALLGLIKITIHVNPLYSNIMVLTFLLGGNTWLAMLSKTNTNNSCYFSKIKALKFFLNIKHYFKIIFLKIIYKKTLVHACDQLNMFYQAFKVRILPPLFDTFSSSSLTNT